MRVNNINEAVENWRQAGNSYAISILLSVNVSQYSSRKSRKSVSGFHVESTMVPETISKR